MTQTTAIAMRTGSTRPEAGRASTLRRCGRVARIGAGSSQMLPGGWWRSPGNVGEDAAALEHPLHERGGRVLEPEALVLLACETVPR